MAPVPSTASAPLTFDQFWRYLQDHAGCVVRAGVGDCVLFDADALHWDFFEEPDGAAMRVTRARSESSRSGDA